MLGGSSHPPNVEVAGAPCIPGVGELRCGPSLLLQQSRFSAFQPQIFTFPIWPWLPGPCGWMLHHQHPSASPIACGRLCRMDPPAPWTRWATAVLGQLQGAGGTQAGPGVNWGGTRGGHSSSSILAMRKPGLLCSLAAHAESRQRRGCFDWKRKNEQTTFSRFLFFFFPFF